MKSFLKYFLASFLAFLIATIIGVFILIGTVSSLVDTEKVVKVKPNSVLKITLDKPIMDRAPKNPFAKLSPMNFEPQSSSSLSQILDNIDRAKNDSKIKGIFLYLDNITAGSATVTEVRNALASFKDSGKFIISYGNYYSQKAFYLATVADKVYVNPEGMVGMQGLTSQVMFFKKTLEKIGVEPQVIRHGKYKSAVEPFLDNKMSEANREQIAAYMGSLWNEILMKVGSSRNLKVDELQRIADEMLLTNVDDVVEYNLADGARYYDQVMDELKTKAGTGEGEKLAMVTLGDYTHAPKPQKDKLISKMDKIAVVYAQGQIGAGKGSVDEIGTENVAKALRKVREDDKVKAVVLRVNSPGGSALTSEVIFREVQLVKEKKPVIVSMGDVAASGGYYISCMADTIVASPNTITGSIGVFGLLFQARELIEEKIGINVETVNTAKHADMGSPFRPLDRKERAAIKKSIEDIYQTFIGHVANGRGMTKEEVDKVAQGRVWSGRDALEIGLVDVLGGLNDAIEIAAERAGVEDYVIKDLPKQKDPIQQMLEEFGANASMQEIFLENTRLNPYLEHLKSLSQMKGVQMRLPYDIIIE
ncbi:Protease 4 [Salinivirga cyanobacteriivorans]|uniref:Protease 4 n=1 Tax=Salinivirga cyanobacteriivorans TaxID=1307839 RepID=A0A0S2HYL1_9BACT|nr:signal peptide peptidase SppA [Salinivirga cyanobacteriivorans]ALO15121.1 Protease 4 [Salinivirga cyanobacteriivorans]